MKNLLLLTLLLSSLSAHAGPFISGGGANRGCNRASDDMEIFTIERFDYPTRGSNLMVIEAPILAVLGYEESQGLYLHAKGLPFIDGEVRRDWSAERSVVRGEKYVRLKNLRTGQLERVKVEFTHRESNRNRTDRGDRAEYSITITGPDGRVTTEGKAFCE